MTTLPSIETRCRGCGVLLTLPGDRGGARVRCPACRLEMSAPVATDADALESVCHYCGALAPTPGTGDYRVCQLCQESIDQNDDELRLAELHRERSQKLLLWLAAIGAVIWLALVGYANAAPVLPPSCPRVPTQTGQCPGTWAVEG